VIDRLSGQAAVNLMTATLSDEQAELLMWRGVGELDVLRVAEIMGRSPNWVRVNQHRALRHMAEALAAVGAGNSVPGVIPGPQPAIFTP